jgi:hypothetical protein
MLIKVWVTKISLIWWVALLYLTAISLAEVLTILVVPWVGLVLHGVILLTLLLHSSLSNRKTTRRFLTALALVPLTRLLSLVLPLKPFPFVYWYLIVGVPLFIAAAFAARAGNMSRKNLGLTMRNLPVQALVTLTGIGLGYLEYLILRPEPLIADLRLDLIWLPALILLIFTGLLEEFICCSAPL